MSILFEPSFRGVVLHGTQGRVLSFDPDWNGLESGERVAGDEDTDALEMVCEQRDGTLLLAV